MALQNRGAAAAAPHPKRKVSHDRHRSRASNCRHPAPGVPTKRRLWASVQHSSWVEGKPAQLLECLQGPKQRPASRLANQALAGARRGAARRGWGQKLTNRGHKARAQGFGGDQRQSRGRVPLVADQSNAEPPGPWGVARPGGIQGNSKRCVRALVGIHLSNGAYVASLGSAPSTFLPRWLTQLDLQRVSAPAPHRLGAVLDPAGALGVWWSGCFAVQQHQRTAGGHTSKSGPWGSGRACLSTPVPFLLLLWSLWQAWAR